MWGFLRDGMWKSNLAMLVALVIVIALVVGGVYWTRKSQGSAPGDNANDVRVLVGGTASKGVAVTFSDSHGTSVLRHRARLPFHQSIPTNGGSFYQLQAQMLGKESGSISCRIALGAVVSTHHSSGGPVCVAGVGHGRGGWAPT